MSKTNFVISESSIISAFIYFCFFVLSSTGGASAQTKNIFLMSPEERSAYLAKINTESYIDWKKMADLLQIQLPDSLPSPAEDPNRPTFTFQKDSSTNWYDTTGNLYTRTAWGTWNNYDENKANPFPDLPDPLRFSDGKKVTSAKMWWKKRRPEIAADFEHEIFGKVPDNVPAVHWKIISIKDTMVGTIPVITKEIVGQVDNAADTTISVNIQLTLTTPAKIKRPAAVIMEFGFVFPPGFRFPGLPSQQGPTWQEQVLEKGWGYAIYVPTSVQPDNGAGLNKGIIGLTNKGQSRTPEQWGALRAWAWGASRVLDYFEKDKSVNAKKVGLEGVSRYGKAVLLTMAFDQRFAIVLVGSSGKGGAALYRRYFGEDMGNICSSGGYHWFAGNLFMYVLKRDSLSVDSHELIALCAPRPVFISCGSPQQEGNWVDDKGQFLATAAAQPVFELLGEKGIGTSTMPPIDTGLLDGTLAFRQHHGGHTVGPNWSYFLTFAERYFYPSNKNFSK